MPDDTISYLKWKKDVADHDYAAASSYLSIRYGESRAEEISKQLRKLPVISRRANDILRAVRRDPLPLSDPGVLRDLQKVLAGEKLSPVLVATASANPCDVYNVPPTTVRVADPLLPEVGLMAMGPGPL